MLEALCLFLLTIAVYLHVRKAKEFKDYRAMDYVIIGAMIYIYGILTKNTSIVHIGSIVWVYGLAILLYRAYRFGYEEVMRD
ncbi:MAG: hypothetical protein DRP01_03515 [Archaeoglobales archaeon]|nr:MAG: hypothetical protein DRP01_03515 [Archaeoglobales archaeon]